MPDVEVTLGEGNGCFFDLEIFFSLWRLGVYMLTLFNIFSAAEQMVAAILIARVSLSGTTERRFSCDL